MTTYHDQVVLGGTPADLARVVDFVEICCESAGVEDSARLDLQLATEEACANVIKHAYDGRGGQLVVRFETHDRDVVLTVHDRGKAFDPERVTEPDFSLPLDERPAGGLGLHLMRKLMDEVRFTFSAHEGNTLVMVKRNIVPPSATGSA